MTDTGIIFKTLFRNKREKRRWFPKNDFRVRRISSYLKIVVVDISQ